MKPEFQITFRNVRPSKQVEDWVRSEAEKLETAYSQLMRCRVVIELPHHHHQSGNRYDVGIRLSVPQGEIVIRRDPSLAPRARRLGETETKKQSEIRAPHKEVRVAIHDAFKAARRRLQDYGRRQAGFVKSHVALPEARVTRVFPQEGYGYLVASDGREVYFHRNSVLNQGFPRLKVGTLVRFVEEPGEKGPQASTVYVRSRQGRTTAAQRSEFI